MATGEIVKPREIVKANNELFRCKYKIKDLVANRIFMSFASLVDHKDVKENQSFVEYQISASSIISNDVDSGEKYNAIRSAAYTLLDQKIEQKVGKTGFKAYTLFSTIEYNNGIIRGEFHKDLIPFFIIAREKFTKLKLTEYIELPSIYSQSIFGLLKSWSDKNEITIKLSELHTILDSPQSFIKDFRQFRTRVLEKAYKDINEKTSLSYEWEPIKTGRSFSEIKFRFIKKVNAVTSKSAQTGNISQPALTCEPAKNSVQPKLNAFCAKFQDGNRKHLEAGIKWYGLQSKGIAPLAEDVPENNELGIIEFLKQWEDAKTKC